MIFVEGLKSFPPIHGISDRNIDHALFLKKLGIDRKPLVRLDQVHKGNVVKVGPRADLSKKIPGCDGAITNSKGMALAILTADCLPIFFYDPEKNAIGIAHAGWRSTKEKIAKNVVDAMKVNFKSNPSQIIIGLGPSLRQCCYEVSSEFLVHFPDSVVKMAHKYYFDLSGENVDQLLSAGIDSRNIFDCGICTSCRNDDFFSYRKEKDKAGRMISVIMLR